MQGGLDFSGPNPAPKAPDGRRANRCASCGGFASFGFGVRLRTGREGLWYCRNHIPPDQGRSFLAQQPEGRR